MISIENERISIENERVPLDSYSYSRLPPTRVPPPSIDFRPNFRGGPYRGVSFPNANCNLSLGGLATGN